MRGRLSSHFCPGKVPLCTYPSLHTITFLPRHPAGIYPLECPFHRYVRALWVLGCSTFPVSDAPWHYSWEATKWLGERCVHAAITTSQVFLNGETWRDMRTQRTICNRSRYFQKSDQDVASLHSSMTKVASMPMNSNIPHGESQYLNQGTI